MDNNNKLIEEYYNTRINDFNLPDFEDLTDYHLTQIKESYGFCVWSLKYRMDESKKAIRETIKDLMCNN